MRFNEWDSLTDEAKVAQVRMEVEGVLPITQVDPQWQQAMDDLTDEKANLALVLRDVVTEWDSLERQGIYYGRFAGVVARAKFALANLNKPEEA